MVILSLLAYGVYREDIKAANLCKKSDEKDCLKGNDSQGDVSSFKQKENHISPKQFPEHDVKRRGHNHKVYSVQLATKC